MIELNSECLSALCCSCTYLLPHVLDRPWTYVIALSLALSPHQALELVHQITWLEVVHGHCSGPVGLCWGVWGGPAYAVVIISSWLVLLCGAISFPDHRWSLIFQEPLFSRSEVTSYVVYSDLPFSTRNKPLPGCTFETNSLWLTECIYQESTCFWGFLCFRYFHWLNWRWCSNHVEFLSGTFKTFT